MAIREKINSKGTVLSPEDIKRVKGLGCLQDKRYPDIFNAQILFPSRFFTFNTAP